MATPSLRHTLSSARLALHGLYSDLQRDAASRSYSALSSSTLNILDVYHASESDVAGDLRRVEDTAAQLESPSHAGARPVSRCLSRTRSRIVTFTVAPSSWLYLNALGALAACLAMAVDATVSALLAGRAQALREHPHVAYLIWSTWCVALALAAAGVAHATPLSEGSGIPQIKSILAGTDLNSTLSLRTALSKLAGLILAQGAGLSVGKEGPFVHITCAIAATLWRVPYFNSIARSDNLRRAMLSAGVAAGVTAVFGTPVGAVLFAIETTSTYFLTSSYWRCFLTAIVCRFGFEVMAFLRTDTTLARTAFPPGDLNAEVLSYIALGVLCGVVGSMFVWSVNKARIARRLVMTSTLRRYVLVAAVALTVATLTYSTVYMMKGDKEAINDLFSDVGTDGMQDWSAPNLIFSLSLFFLLKFTVTVLSISLPVACGLFIPLFVMGAAAGRLFGEAMRLTWPAVMPGAYAVVGAAALTSGATQTVSTAVIVFELTGQTSHLLPVLLGTLVAYSVSGLFTISIYDLLLKHAGLPYLPRVYASDVYNLIARDVMHTDVKFLTTTSTHREALELLHAPPYTRESEGTLYAQRVGIYPVVESTDRPVLCGAVSRGGLESFFRRARDRDRLLARRPPQQQPSAVSASGYDAPKLVTMTPAPALSPIRSLSPSSDADDDKRGLMHAAAPHGVPVSLTYMHVQAHAGTPARALTPARAASAAARASLSAPGDDREGDYTSLRSPDRVVMQVHTQSGVGTWWSRMTQGVRAFFTRNAAEVYDGPADGSERNQTLEYLRSLLSSTDDIQAHAFDDAWLDAPLLIHGVSRRTPREGDPQLGVRMDPAPFQVADMTPLTKIHYLFAICLFSDLLVTRDGMLAGIIVKDDLINPRRLSGERLTNTSTSGEDDIEANERGVIVTTVQ